MAGSAPVSMVRAVLWGGLVLFTAGCASRPSTSDGSQSVQRAPGVKDPGLSGNPEDKWADAYPYRQGLHWSLNLDHIDVKIVDCKDANDSAVKIVMMIQPEERANRLAPVDFRTGNGRFVARVTNLSLTHACKEWRLPPRKHAYLWMGPKAGAPTGEVRLYLEDSSTPAYVKLAFSDLDTCDEGDHGRPMARWDAECNKNGVRTHGSAWVSCSGGCCYSKSLGLIP